MLQTNDLEKGTIIKIDGQPWEVIESKLVKLARRPAFVRLILKNIKNKRMLEKVFKSGQQFEEIELIKKEAIWLYHDRKAGWVLMGKKRISFPLKSLGNKIMYLREKSPVKLLYINGKCIGLQVPKKVDLKVIGAPPGVKGNTASSLTKTVTLETGLKVTAPLFIKEGDFIRINTEKGKYTERVS